MKYINIFIPQALKDIIVFEEHLNEEDEKIVDVYYLIC